MKIGINELLKKIDFIEYSCSQDTIISSVVRLEEIDRTENAICWCSDKNASKLIKLKSKSVIIVSDKIDKSLLTNFNFIIVKNPRLAFQKVLASYFATNRPGKIHSSAFISSKSVVGNNVYIGHNVVIEEGCEIGDNVVILSNSVILERTIIGDNVSIGSNSTIGGVGFGYEKNLEGDFKLVPHIGNVVINNNVDIGSNVCIDRAVIGGTIIHDNVKIDNLVHIAHGVVIGRNTVVIANAMIAGSVEIGENSWIAPSSSIINKSVVGSNSLIGLGAIVTKDVEDNTVVAGNPAKFIRKVK